MEVMVDSEVREMTVVSAAMVATPEPVVVAAVLDMIRLILIFLVAMVDLVL